ncbi:MAG TPA: hypothetical protein VIG76_13685 [Amnibacterium sp.]
MWLGLREVGLVVAEADGPALGLDRRLGLQDAETRVQLTRMAAS